MMTAAEKSDKKDGSSCEVLPREGEEKDKENEDDADEFCFECKSSLAKSRELINITGQSSRRWHPECFKCMVCHEPMDKRPSCHVYKDQIFCRSDYLRIKRDQSIKCKRCQWPIGSSDWVRRAAEYVYHLACFNCDICFRQLNTGEQFVINSQPIEPDRDTDEANCADRKTVRLMCKLHFTVDTAGRQSRDNHVERTEHGESPPAPENLSLSINKANKTEHQSSIKVHCKQRQRSQALKSDHLHLLTPSGASCSSSIVRSEEQVSRPTVSQSQQQQPPPVAMAPQHLVSKDFSLIVPSPTSSSLMIDDNFVNRHHRVASSGSTASSSTTSSSSTTTLGCTSGPMTPAGCSGGSSSGLQSKSKRVRTTFTEDQLSILQTHFQIDSNPDGQDLERIATITGLSKRVTQVWFQNSRARQKKYMIKRKPNSHGSAAGLSALNHPHHLNQRQHNIHQGLALVNQSMNSPSGVPLSPNLELSSSPIDRPTDVLNQHRAVFDDFSRQFREMPYGQGAVPSDSRSTGDKENEEINRDLDMDLDGEDDESIESASDDDANEQQLRSSDARSELTAPGQSNVDGSND